MTREPGIKQLIFPICRKAESENCAIDAHHTELSISKISNLDNHFFYHESLKFHIEPELIVKPEHLNWWIHRNNR